MTERAAAESEAASARALEAEEAEDEQLDAADLLAKSLETQRVAFVPGRAFFADGSGGNTLRLSFSCADQAQIEEGITRLGRLLRE